MSQVSNKELMMIQESPLTKLENLRTQIHAMKSYLQDEEKELSWTKFKHIVNILTLLGGGPFKSGSGILEIAYSDGFHNDLTIDIEIGGYDIGDWSRHERMGGFETELEAQKVLCDKLLEGCSQIENDLKEYTEDTD